MKAAVLIRIAPESSATLTVTNGRVDASQSVYTMSSFAQSALEAALLLKDAAGLDLTVVSAAPPEAEAELKRAVACGADRAVRIDQARDIPPVKLAAVYGEYVKRSSLDLVITDAYIPDLNFSSLAPLVAHYAGMKHLSNLYDLSVREGRLYAMTDQPAGAVLRVNAALPLVVSVHDFYRLRYGVLADRVRTEKQDVAVEIINLLVEPPAYTTVSVEPGSGRRAKMIEGAPDEVASQLIEILRSKGVLDI